jgi:hypothetical protein
MKNGRPKRQKKINSIFERRILRKKFPSGGGNPSLVDKTHLLIMLAFKEPAIAVTMNIA